MNLQRIGNTEHVIYDSLEELEAVAVPLCKQHNKFTFEVSMEGQGHSKRWFGVEGGGHQARQKILRGWPQLLQTLQPMLNRLEISEAVSPHKAIVRRRKMQRSDSGDFLDIHRVNSGELDKAWIRPKRINLFGVTNRSATIVINTALSAATSFDDALWRCAVAVKICGLLQASGLSVEIYSGSSVTGITGNLDWNGYCRIKEYLQPLQEERLAAMCSAAFLRTYMFIAIGSTAERVASGLGHPSQGLPIQLQERKKNGELVVELGRCFSFEDAKRDLEKAHQQLIEDTDGQLL